MRELSIDELDSVTGGGAYQRAMAAMQAGSTTAQALYWAVFLS